MKLRLFSMTWRIQKAAANVSKINGFLKEGRHVNDAFFSLSGLVSFRCVFR